jgi:hypothetical protein
VAINITSKILDHQFNPEAKKFLEVFAKTKIEHIHKMKLGLHILRIGSQNNPGLVCLFHYLSNNSKEINPSDVVGSYRSYKMTRQLGNTKNGLRIKRQTVC